ncbi:hypothetical protein BGW80DRAFT_169585 [Lactifluus volemus]|nr:hypothetical protein BGW80DRAFT_169585 [Lactifluus volemus]
MGRSRITCFRDDDGSSFVCYFKATLADALEMANSTRRDSETLHPEVEQNSPSHHKVDMTNTPQQYPSPHDQPPVHTHPSSVPDHRPLVDSPSPSDLPNLTLFEESGNHGVIPTVVGSPSGTNSVGAGITPELFHGAMAPPVRHNPSPSPSQPQSMAQFLRQALGASRIAPNQGVVKRARPPPKVWCPKPGCKRGFHAPKALNRHLEDCHSEEKNCYHSGCDFSYIGKRKLEAHLQSFMEKFLQHAPLELKKLKFMIHRHVPSLHRRNLLSPSLCRVLSTKLHSH